jgi:hypothetical protein
MLGAIAVKGPPDNAVLLPSLLQPGAPSAEFDYDPWLESGDFTLFAGTQLAYLVDTADSGGARWPNLSMYRSTPCDCANLCRVQPSDMVGAAGFRSSKEV